MKDRSHDEAMAEIFRADPSYASQLLAQVVRDGDMAKLAILKWQLLSAALTIRDSPDSFSQSRLGMAFFMVF